MHISTHAIISSGNRHSGTTMSYNSATIAYMTAIGIANDSTIYWPNTPQEITGNGMWNVIDNLVLNLKGIGTLNSSVNFWTGKNIKAFYPFAGDTAAQHKFNLISPIDSDVAFRLTFNGTWVHSRFGALPNGTNAYANTHLTPLANFTASSANFGRYNGTLGTMTLGVELGVSDIANTNVWACFTNYTAGKIDYFTIKDYGTSYSPDTDNGIGFYFTNRNSSTVTNGFKNGIQVSTGTETPITLEPNPFYIGALNKGGTADNFDDKEVRQAHFMDGLTDSEALIFHNIVDKFQSDLGRASRNAYYFGDSITEGATVSGSQRFTTLLSREFCWNEFNYGLSGTTLTKTTPQDVIASPNMVDRISTIPVYTEGKDGVLFFSYGVNDCGLYFPNYTPTLFGTQLETVIDGAIANGWPLNRIIIHSCTYVDPSTWAGYQSTYSTPSLADTTRFLAYQSTAQSVSLSKGVIFINPYNEMVANGGNTLLSDGRHPNAAGHLVVANYDTAQLIALGF